MKRITDKDFVYHSSATHSDPANFKERMEKYKAATERSPISQTLSQDKITVFPNCPIPFGHAKNRKS